MFLILVVSPMVLRVKVMYRLEFGYSTLWPLVPSDLAEAGREQSSSASHLSASSAATASFGFKCVIYIFGVSKGVNDGLHD
mgnify:CR=1 FL=1